MSSWFVAASAVIFTFMAVGAVASPRREKDAIAALLLGVFATWGWLSVVQLLQR